MKNKIYLFVMVAAVLLQVACTDKDKQQAVAYCTDNSQECAQRYIEISGGAAASGTTAQVAATGASVSTGQVPSTAILPASTLQSQVYAKAAQVQAALKAMDGEEAQTTSTATTASSSTPASIQPASVNSEIGVTRLSEESVPSEARAPASETMDNGSSVSFTSGAAQ